MQGTDGTGEKQRLFDEISEKSFDKEKEPLYTIIKYKEKGKEKKSTFSRLAKRASIGGKKCSRLDGRWSWSRVPTTEV